ncbi:MAG: LysR family transcriptional regulator [Gracilibacteraceae bacterium]|jgi:DNA-binding transcriptional LysR family regulator|nr:LysR family transcriptional regulator [Gracilibacteraceae bacterium]
MSILEQQLQVFKEVAETKNITLAAKKLHMSQPSISVQIQNLEQGYGAKFLDRTNKGVSLTQAGEVFYSHICEVLEIMRDATGKIKDLAEDQRGSIYVGATLTIGEYVLPHILEYLFEVRPEIDFRAKIANTEIIARDVLEKRIHIGLVEGPVAAKKDLITQDFWQDELVVVAPYHHAWANRSAISLAELAEERMITREQGSGTRRVMELALEERGFDPGRLNVTMELGSTQAVKQVVAAGLGIAIISALTVAQECRRHQLRVVKIKDCQLSRPLSVFTHAKTHQTKDERFFIDFLRDRIQLEAVLGLESQSALALAD